MQGQSLLLQREEYLKISPSNQIEDAHRVSKGWRNNKIFILLVDNAVYG